MGGACAVDCESCPALSRCGRSCNFCGTRNHAEHTADGCDRCGTNPWLRMDTRAEVMQSLGGLGFDWPRPLVHSDPVDLPDHLPVLVQGYSDQVDIPWVALHLGRVIGDAGAAVTAKHRGDVRAAYGLGPRTRIALEGYVEDRVLEGLWANRRTIIGDLAQMDLDVVLAPNFSVWSDAPRFEQLVQIRRAFAMYHEMVEAGLRVIPDVSFSMFEPDGRLWAQWINDQPGLHAISLFCGGRRLHADRRAHRESIEDVALLHEAVHADVSFVIGGVNSAERIRAYRAAAPNRRLHFCNGAAYATAQRRRLLDGSADQTVARSSASCYMRNCAHNDRLYAALLRPARAA